MKHYGKLRQWSFNMVEVVLALVIIVIGVVGVMSLFPVAQRAQTAAITTTSAQDAADQFLRQFTSKVKERWAIIGALPQENPRDTVNDASSKWELSDANDVFQDIEGLTLFYNDEDNDRRFDYELSSEQLSKDDSGLFKLVQKSTANVEDFSAILRVWNSPAMYKSYNTASGFSGYQVMSRERGIQVNVELSYPAHIPYARREKSTYSQVIFRPTDEGTTEPAGNLALGTSGKLKVTYFGSSAGYKNAFWMVWPDEIEIFESQNRGSDIVRILDTVYDAQTEFNFASRIQPNWNNPNTFWWHYAWAEPLISPTGGVGGSININPNNSDDFEFTLEKADGTLITRDDLLHNRQLSYNGAATMARFKPKGNGNQNGMTLNGSAYDLQNGTLYTVTGNLQVYLRNTNNNGNAMGKWWIDITATNATIAGGPLIQDPNARWPFYDSGNSTNRNGANDKVTGSPYCITTEIIPGKKWLLGFEDIPGYSGPDWDFNDIVCQIELLPDDGVVFASMGEHTVSGRIDCQASGASDWRLTVVKPDGTLVDNYTLGNGYTGPALCVWARPQGSGSQNLTVDGSSLSWDNANMVAISSASMTVDVKKVSGKWVCDVNATQAEFSVMQ